MKGFIDIHKHSTKTDSQAIINCFPSEIKNAIEEHPQQFFSVGLHPWHIKEDYKSELDIVTAFAKQSQVVAIGEAGLDKLCKTPFTLQQEVFKQQIHISEISKKPLIIHCVKSYSEIIQLKKSLQPNAPWILHGYRGNKNITEQLLKNELYFSLGKGISLIHESLQIIPLEKLFLETDEENLSIEEIYAIVAETKQFTVELLVKSIEENFKCCFKK